MTKCPDCGEISVLITRKSETVDRKECLSCTKLWHVEGCFNGEGSHTGPCELVKGHVGYPCRSATWEWDSSISQPRQPETPSIWWPVFRVDLDDWELTNLKAYP